mmetsp:Transcript_46504/g.141144  ORF Transcript_46504/g.141144 Transcript_46504/m.141144 type:complete len:216 (+) Transcript_46504:4842-5489(+)
MRPGVRLRRRVGRLREQRVPQAEHGGGRHVRGVQAHEGAVEHGCQLKTERDHFLPHLVLVVRDATLEQEHVLHGTAARAKRRRLLVRGVHALSVGHSEVLPVSAVHPGADEGVQDPEHRALLEVAERPVACELLLLAALRQEHEERDDEQALAICDAALRHGQQGRAHILRLLDAVEVRVEEVRDRRRRRLPAGHCKGVLLQLPHGIRRLRQPAL